MIWVNGVIAELCPWRSTFCVFVYSIRCVAHIILLFLLSCRFFCASSLPAHFACLPPCYLPFCQQTFHGRWIFGKLPNGRVRSFSHSAGSYQGRSCRCDWRGIFMIHRDIACIAVYPCVITAVKLWRMHSSMNIYRKQLLSYKGAAERSTTWCCDLLMTIVQHHGTYSLSVAFTVILYIDISIANGWMKARFVLSVPESMNTSKHTNGGS